MKQRYFNREERAWYGDNSMRPSNRNKIKLTKPTQKFPQKFLPSNHCFLRNTNKNTIGFMQSYCLKPQFSFQLNSCEDPFQRDFGF